MELRVLRYFLTIAKTGNITRAAHLCFVTQPTLSRQIKELEEELGHKLLIRGNHSVTLTTDGMLLRKRAEEILELVDKTVTEFRATEESGDVYIGGGESESMKYIAALVKKLQASYPKVRYHLYSGNADDVTERLDKSLLDFGVLIQPTDISKYHSAKLPAKDIWGVVMRKDSPLAKKNVIYVEDLLGLPLVCSRQVVEAGLGKNEFTAWFGEHFEKLNIVCTYNLLYNAALMVEEGIGYAVTLDKLINSTSHSQLCFRVMQPKLEAGLSIVWKKNHILSKAAELFLEKIKEEFTHEFANQDKN